MTFDFTTIDLRVLFAALAVILTFIGIFYFQWFKNRKRLSHDILSNVLLISAEEEIQDKVEIRFEGQPVKNVHLVVIKVVNDGYVPIKKDDFETPVRFIFNKAQILTAEKVKVHPEDLATNIHHGEDWLEIGPALFNRKDYIQVKLLLTGTAFMKVSARIVGVSKVGKVAPRVFDAEMVMMVVIMITLGTMIYLDRSKYSIPFVAILVITAVATVTKAVRRIMS